MKDGFILLHRKLRDNVLWPKNKPFTKMEAWIDLLMMARFDKEPIEVLLGNEVVMCGRGQIVRSINTYQKRWNWGAQRVKSFFEILLKLKQIEKKTTTKTTIITICNYDSYQSKQQTDNKRIINGKQTDNKQITIKNKENKENKENKDKLHLFKNSVYFDFEVLKKEIAVKYHSYDLKYYHQNMIDYSESKGAKYKNWLATCRSWINRDIKEGKANVNNNGGKVMKKWTAKEIRK